MDLLEARIVRQEVNHLEKQLMRLISLHIPGSAALAPLGRHVTKMSPHSVAMSEYVGRDTIDASLKGHPYSLQRIALRSV